LRILLLSQWCHPEPGPRVHELADGLAKRGHQVTLVTGFPTYPKSHFYEGYRPSFYRRDSYGEADILRLPLFPHGGKSAAKRILNYSSFMFSVAGIGSWLSKPVDCMYVFLPPPTTGLAACFLSLAKRAPFLCDVQDIWPEAVLASGMLGEGNAVKAISSVQNFIYGRANRIAVPSPGYRKNLMGKGVDRDKIEVVPNWADVDVYKPVAYDEVLAEKYGLNGKFNVLFAGNFGVVQALDTVIEAADQLRGVPDIQFVFAGSGVEEARLRTLSEEKGLGNVRFLGRFSHEEMAPLYAIADALLVHLKKDPLFEITIPSKTLAYLACAKPLIMAVEGDAAELVESVGAGMTCASEDPTLLAAAVQSLHGMSATQRQAMGDSGRNYLLGNCTLDIVVDTYERLLGEICRR
jgi:glycosyltransferase involved in cell wall biosynthesis